MSAREKLPPRRPSVTCRLSWQTGMTEHRFFVTIGFCPITAAPREVFYADGQKTGSQLQHSIQDACVLISLLLQHGVAPRAIGKSLSTTPVLGECRPASVIGVIAQTLAKEFEAA